MALEWDESFVLGIEEIDNQHRMIVDKFNEFSQAVHDGKEEVNLAEMADFLVRYSQSHFVTEERYMQQYHYPKIDEQRREHADFTKDAEELRQKLHASVASRELALAVTGKLVRWVIQHVRNHDREMVSFVMQAMKN